MFHTCKTLNDCARLREKLHARLCTENGGSDWMLDLLNEAYSLKIEELQGASPDGVIRMLDEILAYAETHEKFNGDFFKSVKESSEKYGGKLTDKQAQAVRNCYEKFKIGKK